MKRPKTRAFWTAVLTAALVGLVGASNAAAAGSPNITISSTTPETVLFGDQATNTITATNPVGQPYGYNLTFTDVLPKGVSYIHGSSSFAGESVEPQEVSGPGVGETTLIWSNLADLSPGSTATVSFQLEHSRTEYEVGDEYTTKPGAYINTNPRYIPKFNSKGEPIGPSETSFTGDATTTGKTRITALTITQSASGDNLRGVQDHQKVYTLKVTNNGVNPTSNTIVEANLPADLEYLGCGNEDNTTNAGTNPGSTEEYEGSGPLTGHTAAPEHCLTPQLVETVHDAPNGLPSEVYTHLKYNIGTLLPGESKEITYVAGIPIDENTLTFPGGTPSPGSLEQGANLNNNSGKETYDGEPVVTDAHVSGNYEGKTTIPVEDDNHLARVAKDIEESKSVSKPTIEAGDIDTYTLKVDTSEYRFFNNLNVTDTLPNGLCPIDANSLVLSAECEPGSPSNVPSSEYFMATENPNGTWSLSWNDTTDPGLTQILPNSSTTITYPVRVLAHYRVGHSEDGPVVSNDSWTNTTNVAGEENTKCVESPNCTTSTEKIPTEEADGEIKGAGASAGQSAPTPEISKEVHAVEHTVPINCETGEYIKGTAGGYGPGDEVCFKLTVKFPAGVYTAAPTASDFLPEGTSYYPGSYKLTSENTAAVHSFSSSTPGVLSWELEPAMEDQTFQAVIGVLVTEPDAHSSGDIVGNLFKFSSENTAGQTFPLRAKANFTWSAAELSLLEGVAKINGNPAGSNPPNTDNLKAEAGDSVQIRVDTTNSGTREAENTEIWEDMPSQISCADVTQISSGGTCEPISNRIIWKGIDIPAGSANEQTYTYTIPVGAQPSTTYNSHAGVVDYQTPDNTAGEFTYIPTHNINPNVATEIGAPNARAADDPTDVYTGSPTIEIERNTSITAPGNANEDATIGETVCYVVHLNLPDGTTLNGVPNPVLTDDVGYALDGSRQSYVPGSLEVTYSGGAIPPGVTSHISSEGIITLDFPNGYTVTTPQVYTLNFCAYVAETPSNSKSGAALEDKATLSYNPDSHNTPSEISGHVDTTIVEPNIHLAKTSNAGSSVAPGQTVQYTLTETNPSGTNVSVAYNNKVVDHIPAGVTPLNGLGNPALNGQAVAPSGGIWNASERTITFTGPSLNPGGTESFKYNVKINEEQAANSTLRNVAQVFATSVPTPAPETAGNHEISRSYETRAEDNLKLVDASIAKEGSPEKATIGGIETFTLRATIPAGIFLYDTTVEDTLPNGMTYGSLQSVTCEGGCGLTTTEIPGTMNGNGTTTLAYYLGNITSSPTARVVKIVYTAHVDSTYHNGSEVKAGETLANTTTIYNNPEEKFHGETPNSPPLPSAFENASPPAEAKVKVVEPKLEIKKLVNNVSATNAQPGETVTYTLAVKNTGTSTAYGARVHDQPANSITNVVTAAGNSTTDIKQAWTTPGSQMEWEIPSIAAGATETLTYTAQLIPSSGLTNGELAENTASVPKYFGVPLAEREEHGAFTYREYTNTPPSTAKVTVKLPELGVELTTGLPTFPKSGNAEVNQPFPWRATVSNASTVAEAKNVNLTITLPPNWNFVPGSVVGAGEPTITLSPSGDILEWPAITNLGPGASKPITFEATPDLAAETNPGTGPSNPNIASASDTAEDKSGAKGDAAGPYAAGPSHAQAILEIPHLLLIKTPHEGTAIAGTTATWQVEVKNTGGGTARHLVIPDTLPSGVTYTTGSASSTTPFTESVNNSGPTPVITWDVESLAPGAKLIINVPVHVEAGLPNGTLLINHAQVTSDEQTTPSEDNGKFTVEDVADLQVVKTASSPTVLAGDDLTYKMVVKNNGPSDDTNAQLSDPLPSGMNFSSFGLGASECTNASNTIHCSLGNLAVGAEKTIEVTVEVEGAALGSKTNTATVSSETTDSNPANNTSSVPVLVEASADLSLLKSVNPKAVQVGNDAIFTMTTTNNGVSTAQNVVVTDPLPAGEEFVSSSTGCTASGGTVTCNLGTLVRGQSVNSVITVKGTAKGMPVNIATVTSTTPDPNPSNNTATAKLIVANPTTFTIKKFPKMHEISAGSEEWFTIIAKNTGPEIGYEVNVCDTLGPEWTETKTVPTATGTPPCWVTEEVAPGATLYFHIKARLSITATGTAHNTASLTAANAPPVSATAHVKVHPESGSSHGDEVPVQDVEAFKSLLPGETATVELSCPAGYQMTDAYPRIDAVDQNSGGTLASIEILASHSTSLTSYQFVLRDPTGPDGPGDYNDQTAQVHVYGICIGDETVHNGHKIEISAPHEVTETWAPGNHTASIACGPDETPVDPGFVFNSGYGTITSSENNNSGGWTLGFHVTSPASVTLSIRCMSIWDSTVEHKREQLVLSTKSSTVTIGPGETAEKSVTCSGESNGIVGTEELSEGLLLVGSDPQQKTRVFKLFNPTATPLTATLDLNCVGNRTSHTYHH